MLEEELLEELLGEVPVEAAGVLFEEADGEEELPESETSSVDDSAVVLSA